MFFTSPVRNILIASACAATLLAACSRGGSPANPPVGGLTPVAGDGRIQVTWAAEPGVQYWLFYGPTTSISTSNWTSILGANVVKDATTPTVVSGLLNGMTYSFTMDARTNNGPGGAPTPSKSAVPRPAGDSWDLGAAASGGQDLRGVALGNVYVAVGQGGQIYTSAYAASNFAPLTWAVVSNSGTTNDLNAVSYSSGIYNAVGATGTVLYSTDTVTWTPETSAVAAANSNDLNAIASYGSVHVAVGNGGTIIHSTDGQTWTAATGSASVTTANLRAVTFSTYGGAKWLAVGDGGAVVSSLDGVTWVSETPSGTTNVNLAGLVYGYTNTTTATLAFVAVGTDTATGNGVVLTSSDGGASWSPATTLPTSLPPLNAVVRGSQFIAIGNNGTILQSLDAATWTVPTTNPIATSTTNSLYAIVRSTYDYSAVGAGGTNVYSK